MLLTQISAQNLEVAYKICRGRVRGGRGGPGTYTRHNDARDWVKALFPFLLSRIDQCSLGIRNMDH